MLVCSSPLFSVSFVFPSGASQIVSARQQLDVPLGCPNIQGIRRHLACKSLFLCLTLCIAFYFPPSLVHSQPSLPHNCTRIPSNSFLSVSFILSPTSSPPSTFYRLFGRYNITVHSAELLLWITQVLKMYWIMKLKRFNKWKTSISFYCVFIKETCIDLGAVINSALVHFVVCKNVVAEHTVANMQPNADDVPMF